MTKQISLYQLFISYSILVLFLVVFNISYFVAEAIFNPKQSTESNQESSQAAPKTNEIIAEYQHQQVKCVFTTE